MPTLCNVVFPTGDAIKVYEHREAGHHFATWEVGFLRTLVAHLRPGLVVYDVGAECGEFSALIGKRVGGAFVHLLEPMAENWPTIRDTWKANRLEPPGGCWAGFASDVNRDTDRGPRPGWPVECGGDICTEARFGSVSEHTHLPAITLDDYAVQTRSTPQVITVDVEGAEGLVLTGAVGLMRTARPLIFCAIHAPDALWRYRSETWFAYRQWTHELLFRYVVQMDYEPQFIGDDHESHWVFVPRGSAWDPRAAIGAVR